MNRPLHRCPTCKRGLDEHTRAAMGLRNGELLNLLCPGRIGPSDIDHVLHNGHTKPERLAFIEYKHGGVQPNGGQQWLLNAMAGSWTEANGRQLDIRYFVIDDEADQAALEPIVEWLWPE